MTDLLSTIPENMLTTVVLVGLVFYGIDKLRGKQTLITLPQIENIVMKAMQEMGREISDKSKVAHTKIYNKIDNLDDRVSDIERKPIHNGGYKDMQDKLDKIENLCKNKK